MLRNPTEEEMIRHYNTFKKYIPKNLKSFEEYISNLSKVKNFIEIYEEENNESLELIFSDLNNLNNIPKISCIYILMLDNEVRYVGQTNNLYHRVNYSHVFNKLFNRILFIKCPNKDMRLLIESEILESMFPLYNHFRQT